MRGSFVVLTGASGSGKTTLASAIKRSYPLCEVHGFDSIGVPSAEVMASFGSEHQPGGAWQRAMTFQWVEKIAGTLASGRLALLEGQMRIAFIQEALAAHQIQNARILLVDCDDVTRASRLIHHRKQPELADERMMGWGRYLRQEARDRGCEILDTGERSIDESVAFLACCLGLHPREQAQPAATVRVRMP